MEADETKACMISAKRMHTTFVGQQLDFEVRLNKFKGNEYSEQSLVQNMF